MTKNTKVFFKIDNRRFVIEYTELIINNLKCAHVEFGQRIGPFTAQFTMHNMKKNQAISVIRTVVQETENRYNHFDMVVFTSLDGNIKRDTIYARITKDMAKRQQCQLSYNNLSDTHGKIFVLHRGCLNEIIDQELQTILSKKGLLVIGGTSVMVLYSIFSFFNSALEFFSL